MRPNVGNAVGADGAGLGRAEGAPDARIGAAVVWVAVLYFPLMHQNEVMRQQIVQLDKQIQQEEVASRQLRLEIDSFKTDPKTVERLAREQLGLARPDETVVRFGLPGE